MKRDQFKVQVWNDHDFAWEEMFKGDKLTIPARSHVDMDFYEAAEFKGQIVPLIKKADETLHPKSEKRIRVVEHDYLEAQKAGDDTDDGQEIFQCNKCKKIYNTEAALLKHSDAAHGDEIIIDDAAERVVATRKRGPNKAKTVETTVE